MSLDFPASADALWSIYNSTGVRPEWLIPVLAYESGLNPGVANAAGYPYYGLNQIAGSQLQARGIDPADYLTWPASRQLSTVVGPYIAGQVKSFGPLQSATRVYQANFLPATLKTATWLGDVIATRGDAYYGPNAGLDQSGKGFITTEDLAQVMTKAAAEAGAMSALAQTYARAPVDVGGPYDAVYGLDFPVMGFEATHPLITLALLGLGTYGVVWAVRTGRAERVLHDVKRSVRRGLRRFI